MGKMDDLRALREARYARQTATTAPVRRPRPATAPVASPAPSAPTGESPAGTGDEGGTRLCGHRNMSGRTCTREHGHSAKSHRYS